MQPALCTFCLHALGPVSLLGVFKDTQNLRLCQRGESERARVCGSGAAWPRVVCTRVAAGGVWLIPTGCSISLSSVICSMMLTLVSFCFSGRKRTPGCGGKWRKLRSCLRSSASRATRSLSALLLPRCGIFQRMIKCGLSARGWESQVCPRAHAHAWSRTGVFSLLTIFRGRTNAGLCNQSVKWPSALLLWNKRS